ncbi:MoaD/ThiS family protein [Alterisphingorhabdus coralli]|uniref:MoaD/ThiS family protein n=1 Tax=Alterisphingorhabdus coralli TaxID=3071408 RepID=A0AA97F5W0_9SPHN|nr:MoaD/ThiS family protein [Parasphingorhabdus sp. SCSIO 66989]WOE74954.1 MoaD/ThiS family protein [Parasphingorhabdus sp. SCSIO 66989]
MSGEAHITLLAFGQIGEMIVQARRSISEGETVEKLLNALCIEHNGLETSVEHPRFRVAVNQAVVPFDHILRDGDEVALLSPVSGG